ncbi:hypothetical protein T265_01491 [Opisthorchis viverrini]|uniref:Nucleoside transporter n=1 Tax=Opisthorchis viverrini TaxID=6198 RepID=A0A074ZZD0_OPIVI|nr:hypothetical protein T265_01491 [Opisthorchis viverrini]KER32436.1 hypothetical protein T265_01491 [Opisthorchis viverrini]
MSYLGFAAHFPSLCFSAWNTFYQSGTRLRGNSPDLDLWDGCCITNEVFERSGCWIAASLLFPSILTVQGRTRKSIIVAAIAYFLSAIAIVITCVITFFWLRRLDDRKASDLEMCTAVHSASSILWRILDVSLEAAFKSSDLNEETQQAIRQTAVPAIMRNKTHNALSTKEKRAINSLKADETIVILPADKGRMTVILEKAEYIDKANALLNDTTTYRRLQNDQTAKLTNKINITLKKLRDFHKITEEEYWRMKVRDSEVARFYGLPKVHKETVPLRPIVSLPGTPTYNVSRELWKRLKYLTIGSQYSINNAGQFLEKPKNVRIEEDEIMVSFDRFVLHYANRSKQLCIAVSAVPSIENNDGASLTKPPIRNDSRSSPVELRDESTTAQHLRPLSPTSPLPPTEPNVERSERDALLQFSGSSSSDAVMKSGVDTLRNCFGLCCFRSPIGRRLCREYWLRYTVCFSECWHHCLSIWSVFFCSLSVFPAIQSMVKPVDPNYFIAREYSLQQAMWPAPRYLWIPIWIRTLFFIPFFLFCNFGLSEPKLPVLVGNDHVYVFGIIIFAFTNGYFSSLTMMYAPKSCPPERAEVAGMLTAFFLTLGVCSGVYASRGFVSLIM